MPEPDAAPARMVTSRAADPSPPPQLEGTAGVLQRLGTEVLVCDGAMGTMLHSGGVSLDLSLPALNIRQPDLVRAIHQAYIAAGAQVIETNTFGASQYRMTRHGLEQRVAEVNLAGARLAREAREQSGVASLLVAGSVSPATPTGYRGAISPDDLRAVLGEQIAALVEGGVDLLIFETFGNLAEMVEAVGVAREIADLPIVAQMTFVEDHQTLAGNSPAEVAGALESLGVAVIGANCTLGPQGLLEVLRELARHTSLPLAAQPNAGPPTLVEGQFRYTADPAYFARYARRFVEVGAALVGGCCGTTPAHIEAVAAEVAGLAPPARPSVREKPEPVEVSVASPEPAASAPVPSPSAFADRLAARDFVVACELSPPVSGDTERALQDAALLREAGSDAVVIGPVGSTRAQVSPASLALLVQQRVPQLEAILTITTWDRSLSALQADLLGAYAFGLRNVICRTGTPPPHGDYPNVAGIWDVDSRGLIQILRGLNEGRDHNGIALGRPTAFMIGARINPAADDFAQELATAREKVAGGASFLVTPPVFDVDALARLLDALGADHLPVLLGVMPLQDFRHAEFLQHEVPEMVLPERLLQRMWEAGARGAEAGREIALELIAAARKRGLVHGIILSSGNGSASEMAGLLRALGR